MTDSGGEKRQTRTEMVNEKLELPELENADVASSVVATRGGLESTVGMTSPGAVRCESVKLPSELCHMMTMGVFAIVEPKPL